MNSIKRAWYSVIRKPIKSILLFLAVLVISLFIMAGMSARNANVKIQDKTRQAVGSSLMLVGNEANRHVRMDQIIKRNNLPDDFEGEIEGLIMKALPNGLWYSGTGNSFDTLLIPDIEKIASVSRISDYNIETARTLVKSVNFKRIEDPDVELSIVDIDEVHLIGERKLQLDTYLQKGEIALLEGRLIEPEDKNVCVISQNLAEKNELKIGDKLQMENESNTESSEIYETEVVGIFQIKQKISSPMPFESYRAENMIFTDLRFPEKVEGEEGNPIFTKAIFTIEDVDKYDEIKEEVKKLDIDWLRYDLIDNNGNLETMSENFHSLKKVSTILLIISVVSGLVILYLIFTFWIKNRTHEIGTLMSLGIPKKNIIGQILAEGLIIGIIALLFSVALSPTVSSLSANYLVGQQEEVAEIEKEKDIDGYVGVVELEQDIQGIEVKITKEMVLADGAMIIALIGASVLISSISIMVKKPKEILSEMS